MIFAVDFDGTIVTQAWPDIGEERKYAIFVMKKLQESGHKIIIWTGRNGKQLSDIMNWFLSKKFFPDAVNANLFFNSGCNNPKIHADVYIEDKSFPPFTNWVHIYNVFIKNRPIDELMTEDTLFCSDYLTDHVFCKYYPGHSFCNVCTTKKLSLDHYYQ